LGFGGIAPLILNVATEEKSVEYSTSLRCTAGNMAAVNDQVANWVNTCSFLDVVVKKNILTLSGTDFVSFIL
jgi:hypothetical protein